MALKRLLLFGEGPAETGRPDRWAQLPARPTQDQLDIAEGHEGAGSILLRRTLEATLRIPPESLEIDTRTLTTVKKHTGGIAGKVAAAMALAEFDKRYDACCILTDRDRQPSRPAEMEEGRRHARQRGTTIRTALGCPTETLEAWLLADPSHLREAYQAKDCPPHPEKLDGGPGASNHPKTVLQQWVKSGEYPDVARSLSLPTLRSACPSYAAFADEVAAELKP